MHIPSDIESYEIYSVSSDRFTLDSSCEDWSIIFDDEEDLELTIFNPNFAININISISEKNGINVNIVNNNVDQHWIDFISPKLEKFISSNICEYTTGEYLYIVNTIIRSIEKAIKPLFEFEIYTNMTKSSAYFLN